MSQLQLPLRKERAGKCDQPWRFSRVRVLLSPLLCSKHIWHWLCSLPSPAPQHGFSMVCRSLTAFHTHLLTSDRQEEKKEKQHWAMKVKDKFRLIKTVTSTSQVLDKVSLLIYTYWAFLSPPRAGKHFNGQLQNHSHCEFIHMEGFQLSYTKSILIYLSVLIATELFSKALHLNKLTVEVWRYLWC